jgi:hypothetical protein
MKRNILYMTIILLILFSAAGQPVSAQDKTQQQKEQEQKDKEAKLKQAIETQKKLAEEQAKQQELQAKEIEKAAQELEKSSGQSSDAINDFYRRSRPPAMGREFYDQGFYVSPGVEFSAGTALYGRHSDSERTTWDFSKYVKESTFSKQYSFDVEKTVNTVVMSVMGDCKSGEIRVKIVMPGGKTYSDILIDESGNLNWRKSFTISDEENKDKAGEWLFKIDAAKATGSFKISLQTY